MNEVKSNPGTTDLVMKFKIIGISVTFGLNTIVFIWYLFLFRSELRWLTVDLS